MEESRNKELIVEKMAKIEDSEGKQTDVEKSGNIDLDAEDLPAEQW